MVQSLVRHVELVRELVPRISATSEAGDRERRPPEEILRELARHGLLRLGLPAAYGGEEADLKAMASVVEDIAAADGSVGWVAATNVMGSITMGRVEAEAAQTIFASPAVVTAGVFAPFGMAERAGDAYRLSGRWPFASGCQVADWFLCGAAIFEEGSIRLDARGRPEVRMLAFPSAVVRIHDTWSTMGLRATGSHDIEVDGASVPRSLTLSLTDPEPTVAAPLYRMPYFGVCSALMGSVAIGIARSAMSTLRALARDKIPLGSKRPILERTWVQGQLAEAESLVSGAREHLGHAIDRCWSEAQDGSVGTSSRAALRLAACRTVHDSVRAADLAHYAAGGSSVYQSAKLERALRDLLTLRQHVMIGPMVRESAARALAGVETDTSML